jgi:polyketide synthase PksN
MRLDEQTLHMLERQVGIRPLETRAAFQALYDAMKLPGEHLIVLSGDVPRMKSLLLPPSDRTEAVEAMPAAHDASAHLSISDVQSRLRARVAHMLGVEHAEVDLRSSFEDLGLGHADLSLLGEVLRAEFGIQMTTTSIHDSHTLHDLAAQIASGLTTPPVEKDAVPGSSQPPATADEERLQAKAIDFFKHLLSSVSKLTINHIDADESFDSYGLDSVMAMQMTSRLESLFGPLSKTLFFEFQTINAITKYFMDHYQEKLPHAVGDGQGGSEATSSKMGTVKPTGRPHKATVLRPRFTPAKENRAGSR